ncbi:hypothetical protein ALC60_06956, partial [Trachymyrmex zeteki]
TFASLTEGTILRGGFAVFIPGAGVAKLLDRPSPRPDSFIPRSFIGVHRQRSSDFEPTDRLKMSLKPPRIPPNNVRVYMSDYDRLSLCKTVHCLQFLVCPQQATTAYNERGFAKKVRRLANPQKNRHERQRWQSASRTGNGVRGQPPNLVKNFAVSSEFQARFLGHNSQARTRRRKTRRNLRKRRLHGCLFLWPLFRRHNSFLALSHSPLISIINDPRSPRDATAPDLRNDKNVFAGTVSATESRQGENKNVSGNGEKKVEEKRKKHGGPLSHFLSGSRVPPVISHYALATNGDANSVSATAAFLESGKKGGGRGRKNGPFNGLIDLLPRRPTVVMARNENVTLYRRLKPWRLTSRTMRSLFAK